MIKEAIKSLKKLGVKQDEISGNIYEKTKNGWVRVPLVDLWIEVCSEVPIAFAELEFLLSSERVLPRFNVVKEWLESLQPAEEEIFNTLANFIDIKRKNSTDRFRIKNSLKKWFVSAVRAVYEKDFAPKYCFVLIGPEGIGKTPFLKSFLPRPLQHMITIDPSCSDLNCLTGKFIIFLESMGHWLRRREVSKSYRTFTSLEGYGGKPRIASFLGASDNADFLKEDRSDRFVIFEIDKIWNKRAEEEYQLSRSKQKGRKRVNFPEDFNMDEVWGAALKMYREGYSTEYSMKDLEELRRHQKLAVRKSSQLEVFYEFFVPAIPNDPKSHFLSAEELCTYLNKRQKNYYFVPVVIGRELKKDGIKRCASQGKKGYYLHYKAGDREDLKAIAQKEEEKAAKAKKAGG